MTGTDSQRWMEKGINIQSDIIRLTRKKQFVDKKEKEQLEEWILSLERAANVYRHLSQEAREWYYTHMSRLHRSI